MESVHWEPEEMPPAEEWSKLDQLLKTHASKLMLWESEPLPETRAKLQELGIQCIVFDPCGNTPDGSDYLTVMQGNLTTLKAALEADK